MRGVTKNTVTGEMLRENEGCATVLKKVASRRTHSSHLKVICGPKRRRVESPEIRPSWVTSFGCIFLPVQVINM